jgi:hypothetical protein
MKYLIGTAEHSWKSKSFYSLARVTTPIQILLTKVLAAVLLNFIDYANNPLNYTACLIGYGGSLLVRVWITTPYHKWIMNYGEMMKGELLLIGGVLIFVTE